MHKFFHGLLGGATGYLMAGEKGITPGAAGAIVGELVAEGLSEDVFMAIDRLQHEQPDRSIEDCLKIYQKEILCHAEWGKLAAALTALLTKQDVEIAIKTASNAVDNNFVQGIPYAVAKVMWEIYVLNHPEDVEAARDAICEYIAEQTGLPLDTVKTVGDLVMTSTSLVKATRSGYRHLVKRFAKVGVKEVATTHNNKTGQRAAIPDVDTTLPHKADINPSQRNVRFKDETNATKAQPKLLSNATTKTSIGSTSHVAPSASVPKITLKQEGNLQATDNLPKKLLPGEGKVGTYGELKKFEQKGDNLTPHHMPQNAYMRQFNVSNKEGVAMMMEQPTPGTGGRHRETRTYSRPPNLETKPRQELAADIKDVRQIYKKDGLYTSEIRNSLKEAIDKNKTKFPELFKKDK